MFERLDTGAAILVAVPKAGRKRNPEIVKTTVELPAELWRTAKIRAMDERIDLRTVFVRALEAFLDTTSDATIGHRKTRG